MQWSANTHCVSEPLLFKSSAYCLSFESPYDFCIFLLTYPLLETSSYRNSYSVRIRREQMRIRHTLYFPTGVTQWTVWLLQYSCQVGFQDYLCIVRCVGENNIDSFTFTANCQMCYSSLNYEELLCDWSTVHNKRKLPTTAEMIIPHLILIYYVNQTVRINMCDDC